VSLSRMRRALAPRLAACVAACVLISALVSGVHAQDAPAALTIDDAVARALDAAPLLRAGEEGLRAADGAYRQAGARPNPELLIEAENFAGSGDFNGVGGAEFSYSLGQQIERGGKRRARRAVAGAERDIAGLTIERTRLDVIFAAEAAFIDAVAADAGADLARARATSAAETSSAVARRVEAAKDPKGAGDSAAAAAAAAASDFARAERERDLAHQQLALLTGIGAPDIALVAPWFAAPPPLIGDASPDPSTSPDLAIFKAAEDRAEAAVALERAAAKQDPTISLGARNLRETRDTAAILSVSMPLAIFNRNKGAIARAEAERRQAAFEREAGALALSREIVRARSVLDTARAEADTLRRDVIPRAETALAGARTGYARGAFTYLEVFSAQTALFDFRAREVEALRRAHLARAEFDRLTARLAAPADLKE
jgi:outer membrane protein, heavy metal efflux system